MRFALIVCVAIGFLHTACEKRPAASPERPETSLSSRIVVEREKTDREPPLSPEVKIRLKRDGKDNYSWELSGSDIDQILAVNEKLRKKVGGERAK
ncbi:MAG: hypothetical protein EHM36_10765 [Deltaproteobacteria bacterium]|nr:MAG: hypothetical protein EHM36_10765 [Deltaproteobacteria bacterium]